MIVVTGAKKILHLIGIQSLAHRDGEDILNRGFIVNSKVRFIIIFQPISHCSDGITISLYRLPGIEPLAIYFKINIFSIGKLTVGPIIIRIYFSIQGKFSK